MVQRADDVITFRAHDHPEANGRRPRIGERQWTISFTLEDGSRLDVLIGKTGHAALRSMLIQEMHDDEFEGGLRVTKHKQISVKSMVASRTGEPAVMFRMGGEFVNMPPADARNVALDLIGAADRAEFEAKFVRHLRGMGMEDAQVGELLALLRAADAAE